MTFCDVVCLLGSPMAIAPRFSGLQKHLLGAESRYEETDAMYHNVKMLRSICIPFHPRNDCKRSLKCRVVLEHSGQSLEGNINFYDFRDAG